MPGCHLSYSLLLHTASGCIPPCSLPGCTWWLVLSYCIMRLIPACYCCVSIMCPCFAILFLVLWLVALRLFMSPSPSPDIPRSYFLSWSQHQSPQLWDFLVFIVLAWAYCITHLCQPHFFCLVTLLSSLSGYIMLLAGHHTLHCAYSYHSQLYYTHVSLCFLLS